eukprot:g1269.t1
MLEKCLDTSGASLSFEVQIGLEEEDKDQDEFETTAPETTAPQLGGDNREWIPVEENGAEPDNFLLDIDDVDEGNGALGDLDDLVTLDSAIVGDMLAVGDSSRSNVLKHLMYNLLRYYRSNMDLFSTCTRLWFVVVGYLKENEGPWGQFMIDTLAGSLWTDWDAKCVVVLTKLSKEEIMSLPDRAKAANVNDVVLTLMGHGTDYARPEEQSSDYRSMFIVDRMEWQLQRNLEQVLTYEDIEALAVEFEKALKDVEKSSPRFVFQFSSCFSSGLLVPGLVGYDNIDQARDFATRLDTFSSKLAAKGAGAAGTGMSKKRKAADVLETMQRADQFLDQDSAKMSEDQTARMKWADRVRRDKERVARLRKLREARKKAKSANGVSKHGNGNTTCAEEYKDSLDCIDSYGRGSVMCERSFAIYKECLKKQHALRVASNGQP